MTDQHYTITTDASEETEQLLLRFERDRDGGPIDFENYVPPREDPSRDAVITELARIDLEYRFNECGLADARYYIERFPDAFAQSHRRTQLAFEEYRLRRRGGEDVSGSEVGARYDVDGSRWPDLHLGSSQATQRSPSRRFTKSELAVPAVHYPAIGGTFAGYPLVARIGEGAYSRVFLARQPDLAGRLVVLKVTPLATDESDRLASLQHSSIIPVYSVHREGDLSCICMPFLGSVTLADLSLSSQRWASLDGPAEELISTILDRRRSTILSVDDAIEPARRGDTQFERANSASGHSFDSDSEPLAQLSNLCYVDALLSLVIGAVEGLAYAHRRGIIHRDLKPANILVADDGAPVLLDFNLAVSSQSSKTQVVGGTLPYMSPQQLRSLETGDAADKRDDIFSIGVILYELLTGRLPFDCPRSGEAFVLDQVVADRTLPPEPIRLRNAHVTPGLESIIERCLASRRDSRYADAEQLLEDLTRFQQHRPLKYARDPSCRERVCKWATRHPRLSSATSVGILAAALLVAGSLLWWQRGRHIRALNVRSEYLQFQSDLPGLITSLSSPGREPELLREGLRQSSQWMNRWAVGSPDWQSRSNVGHLDDASRASLRRELAKLAFAMADSEIHLARQSDSLEQTQHTVNARFWNEQIHSLAPQIEPLASFQMQRMKPDVDHPRSHSISMELIGEDAPLDLRSIWARESGDFIRWRQLVEQQLDREPTDANHWFNLAMANNRRGDLEAAASALNIAGRLQPQSITTLLNRGICYLNIGRTRLALDDFNQCLRINPRMMVPRFNRAVASHRLGDHRAALNDLNVLMQSEQRRTRIALLRREVHLALGNRAAAEADLDTAMEIAPRDANDWTARGIARINEAPSKALDDFLEALEIHPFDTHALMNAAHVYAEHLNETENAIEMLDRLVLVRPNSPSAFASRGILRARTGDTSAAIEDATIASGLSPGGLEQLQIAGIFALSGAEHHREGLHWLARALAADPGLARIARDDQDLATLKNDRKFADLLISAQRLAAMGGK